MPFINDKLKSYQTNVEKDTRSINMETTKINSRTRFLFSPATIIADIRQNIFGQDEMIEKITDMLYVIHADLTEKTRPLYVALFLGPTGVGKTETVKLIAKSIYGDSEAFSRVDMNTLSQEHYAAAITGAPPGYVGSKEGHSVFNEERIEGTFSKPGIVLFDEIEKADTTVWQSLLNVFDNGKMVLTNGERIIDFRNSMIFMTSNLGAKQIFAFAENDLKSKLKRISYRLIPTNWGKSDHEILKKIIKKQMEQHFSPEFINRIDDTIVFNWLGNAAFEPIIEKGIGELNERLRKHGCQLTLDDAAKKFIIEKGFDKHYGARAIRRLIRKELEVPLARFLVEGEEKTNVIYKVTVNDRKLTFQKGQ